MNTGRPTKYKKEFDRQAEILCKKGFTDKEMAEVFGCSEVTLNAWKKKYPSFLKSLKAGKRHSDDLVVDALYNRAIGYTITEKHEEHSDQSGNKTKTVTKQVAGDTTAQIFWLKNRRPDEWRDKQEIVSDQVVRHVMPVPVADSVEDWEESAKVNQGELLG